MRLSFKKKKDQISEEPVIENFNTYFIISIKMQDLKQRWKQQISTTEIKT